MDKTLIKVIRYILVLPVALSAYIATSILCSIARSIVVREDVGLIGYYISLFVANIASCMVCGAAFSIAGLLMSPKKGSSIAITITIAAAIIFLYYAYITTLNAENAIMGGCFILWNIFGIFGSIYGANYCIAEYKRKEEEERKRMYKEYNNTLEEIEKLRSLVNGQNKTAESKRKKVSVIERYRKYKEKNKI